MLMNERESLVAKTEGQHIERTAGIPRGERGFVHGLSCGAKPLPRVLAEGRRLVEEPNEPSLGRVRIDYVDLVHFQFGECRVPNDTPRGTRDILFAGYCCERDLNSRNGGGRALF